MTIDNKKKILMLISFINMVLCGISLGIDIANAENLVRLLYDVIFILIALFPFIILYFCNFKHTYHAILPFAILALFAFNASTYVMSLVGIILTFIPCDKEKNSLSRLMKRHPIYFTIIVVLSGLSLLNCSSLFELIASLTYGLDMLGEFCAALFVLFLLIVLNKSDLIFKNRGSIKEGIIVSLPFIFIIIYEFCTLFAVNFAEGYSLVGFDEIFAIILLYLFVGIFEDFLLRGLALNILLDKYGNNRNGIIKSVILSSIIFGLVHFSNLLTGASFQGVLIQVISAICIGCYFSAIYLRSGSVWTSAILHGVYDISVSVGSFFTATEITSTTSEYASIISEYSWSGLILPAVLLMITCYLLRNSKMSEIIKIRKGEKIEKPKKDGTLKYLLFGFGIGITAFYCYSTICIFFSIGDMTLDLYDSIPIYTDYQKDYGLTYVNDTVTYDNMNDELKILIALNNLENYSFEEIENQVADDAIETIIPEEDVLASLKSIFGKNISEEVNYVDVYVSYKTSCSYDIDNSEYICITTNNDQSNNLKVYTGIASVDLTDIYDIDIYVYYIVEDTETNTLYADSDLKTVYMYDTSIRSISNAVDYEEGEKNKEFWENIKDNCTYIPTYKLSFTIDSTVENIYFESSEFLTDSINEEIKEQNIVDEYYYFTSNKYSFTYDRTYFEIIEESNSLYIKYNNKDVISIKIDDSYDWLEKYKKYNGEYVSFGNNDYYKYNNIYLIYSNDFYEITINYTDNSEINNLIDELLSSVEFY